ncbi:MAG TPA: tetratricopeptide repeat protein, partial [Kofleriaceae bacterium]
QDLDGAAITLAQALELADIAHQDRIRAQAWNNLVHTEYLRGHYEQVVAMRPAALGAIERVGDPKLLTDTEINLGGSLGQLGKFAEAQALFEHVVAVRRGQHDYRYGTALAALGNAYAMQGKLAQGIAAHREAITIVEGALGPMHPIAAGMHGNLASDYLYGLQPDAAIAELRAQIKILEANDPKQRKLAAAHTDLGTAELELGKLDEAKAQFATAEALWLATAPKHPGHADALLGRYLAGEHEIALLEQANVLAEHLPPFQRARIQLALGTAKNDRALVSAAADGFATSTLPLCQRELTVAKTWLAAHGSQR